MLWFRLGLGLEVMVRLRFLLWLEVRVVARVKVIRRVSVRITVSVILLSVNAPVPVV